MPDGNCHPSLVIAGQDLRPWLQPDAPPGPDPGRGVRQEPGRPRPADRPQGLPGQEVQRDGQDQDRRHHGPQVRFAIKVERLEYTG